MDSRASTGAGAFLALLARVRAGDDDAATELVKIYGTHLRRVIRSQMRGPLLRRQIDTADVYQSVFGELFVRLRVAQYNLESPAALSALIATMARNKVSEVRRHFFADLRDVRRDAVADLPHNFLAEESTPSQQAMLNESVRLVRLQMSPEELYIANERKQQRSWEELAEEFGVTTDALRVRFSRALERIFDHLGF